MTKAELQTNLEGITGFDAIETDEFPYRTVYESDGQTVDYQIGRWKVAYTDGNGNKHAGTTAMVVRYKVTALDVAEYVPAAPVFQPPANQTELNQAGIIGICDTRVSGGTWKGYWPVSTNYEKGTALMEVELRDPANNTFYRRYYFIFHDGTEWVTREDLGHSYTPA